MILPEILQAARQHYGSQTAVLDDESEFSWAAFTDRVSKTAAILSEYGIRPGHRFGVYMLNSFRTAELLWAGYWMGAVPVPVNWRLAAGEIETVLDDAEVQRVFSDAAFAHQLRQGPLKKWSDTALFHGPANTEAPFTNIETLLGHTDPAAPHDSKEEDDALMLFTGGTTGRSKGVRLSHRNIVANAVQNGFALGITYGDIWIHAAPMFHSADLIGNSPTLMGGAHVYLPKFSGELFLEVAQRHRPTATVLPPTMLRMVMDTPNFADYDISSFRIIYYGASPMPESWIRDAMQLFPQARICQGYGLTETAPILTVLDDQAHRDAIQSGNTKHLKSAGRPVPDTWLRVVDGNGVDVPMGETGELIVKGPNIMKGYHQMPEATEEALRDGWLYTGDIGSLDEEGYLYLLDRKKDMVITGGENVYTTEVESTIYSHEDVAEAAVIGVPDTKMGEALFAVIVPKEGKEIDEDELVAHCRKLIGGYKIPRHYAFVKELPKSAMGKILKNELREIYGA